MENKDRSGLFRELCLSLKRKQIKIKDSPTENKKINKMQKKEKPPEFFSQSYAECEQITLNWEKDSASKSARN